MSGNRSFTVVVSRLSSAARSDAASVLPVPLPPAACAVFLALQALLPQEEPQHVRAVLALRVKELAAVVQAYSGWAPVEGLAPQSVDGSFLADYSAALLLVDDWTGAAYSSSAR